MQIKYQAVLSFYPYSNYHHSTNKKERFHIPSEGWRIQKRYPYLFSDIPYIFVTEHKLPDRKKGKKQLFEERLSSS